jgi:hypothetical protein
MIREKSIIKAKDSRQNGPNSTFGRGRYKQAMGTDACEAPVALSRSVAFVRTKPVDETRKQ